MLFDWLVTGHIVPHNPATSVRGPKHIVKRGKTPVLTAEEARTLLDSINASTLIGLRDRALIGVMVYSFARVEDSGSLPEPDVLAQEIVDDLQDALEQFVAIAGKLKA